METTICGEVESCEGPTALGHYRVCVRWDDDTAAPPVWYSIRAQFVKEVVR